MTHHPIIQEQVDELLAKGAIEPLMGSTRFYSYVYMFLKHTGGLWHMPNFKQFKCFMHVPSFNMHTTVYHVVSIN